MNLLARLSHVNESIANADLRLYMNLPSRSVSHICEDIGLTVHMFDGPHGSPTKQLR